MAQIEGLFEAHLSVRDSVFFADPDGNVLEYISMLPDRPRPEPEPVSWREWASGSEVNARERSSIPRPLEPEGRFSERSGESACSRGRKARDPAVDHVAGWD